MSHRLGNNRDKLCKTTKGSKFKQTNYAEQPNYALPSSTTINHSCSEPALPKKLNLYHNLSQETKQTQFITRALPSSEPTLPRLAIVVLCIMATELSAINA